MFTKYVLPLIALGLLGFAVVHVRGAHQDDTPSPHSADPPRNPYAHTVAGSGVIEPQTENIAIGSSLPGVVVLVNVQVGQRVKAGDELFRLDDREQMANLRYRQAALEAAQAELTRLENQPRPEELPVSQSQVSDWEANLADQEDQLMRARELSGRKIISAQELVTREQAYRMAKARLNKARAELELLKAGAWKYDKTVARAAVDQARSQVEQVQTEVERLSVRALVDGQVLKVNVRPGEFVGAPATQSLIVLGNVEQLHVRVDIDEHDIPRFQTGSAAKAALRGSPQELYPLTFVRIEPYVVPKKSLTGDNTERVDTRVLQVVYSIDTHGTQLFVGQQLDVFIDTAGPSSAHARFERFQPHNLHQLADSAPRRPAVFPIVSEDALRHAR
ncbi:MAG TPA: HlyD family efflux transporter periplasmic adaptor subunit, partial [Pirellulales bacterium]|nr:HlyD family efflux transporter periplasmic adaptor subunit [Pirellulales bacterium]